MKKLLTLSLTVFLLIATAQTGPVTTLPESVVRRLPPDLQEPARHLTHVSSDSIGRMSRGSDEDLRYEVYSPLAELPEARPVMAAQLEKETTPRLRLRLVEVLRPFWAEHPEWQQKLEQIAASDPDASVALGTLETLRRVRMQSMADLLDKRLTLARASGDASAAAPFLEEQERWISLKNGVTLPGFLRAVPPIFTVSTSTKIRVLAFGDYGTGSAGQRDLSRVMLSYHQQNAFSFGITLGDNFYGRGMNSPDDPRWQTQWEQLYGPLGIKFYATYGNHDWGQPDSPAAEILYSEHSNSWRMPSPYYTYLAGPVQFFALDTNEISDKQLVWLEKALNESKARWKIVYGHHHIFSATRGDNAYTIAKLLPVLKRCHVDLYICGHDHNLQALRPEGALHFVVAGGGGAGLYQLNTYERSLFRDRSFGFAVLEVSNEELHIRLIDISGKQVYEESIHPQ